MGCTLKDRKRPPCVKGAGFLQSKKTGGLLSADDQQSLRQKSKIFATSLYTREAFYFVLYCNKQGKCTAHFPLFRRT